MYGLSHDIDLGFFKKQTLFQICIGANDLILSFDNYIQVTVTSCVGFGTSHDEIQQYGSFPDAASVLVTLLNQTIVSAQGDAAGTLTLEFNGGELLVIYDDSKEYESYVIKNGDQTIVV